MNTLIQEYVMNDYPGRWSNGQQKEVQAHWFEEHPRSCAEDDGGYCSADSLAKYSTDISAAMGLAEVPSLTGKSLSTKTENSPVGLFPHTGSPLTNYWATFSNVEFKDPTYNWKQSWASGETMALAICRAALLAV